MFVCFSRCPAEALERSTAVFAGQVVNRDILDRGKGIISDGPIILTVQVTVQVARVWKGPEYTTLVVHTAPGEASCGYEFKIGTEYLVYARGTEANLQTSLCSRTQLLSAASEDLKVLGEGTAPTIENPGGPLENPSGPKDTQSPITTVVLGLTVIGAAAILVAVVRRRLSR